MATYRLYHREKQEWLDVEAVSAQVACDEVDWALDDVWARERTPTVADPTSESGHRGGGWANVTCRELPAGAASNDEEVKA